MAVGPRRLEEYGRVLIIRSLHTNDGLPPVEAQGNEGTTSQECCDITIDQQPYLRSDDKDTKVVAPEGCGGTYKGYGR